MRAVPFESRSGEIIMSPQESKFLADLFLSVIEDDVKKNVKIFRAIPEARRSEPHQYISARAASGDRDSRSPCRRQSPAPHRGSLHKRPQPQPQPRAIEAGGAYIPFYRDVCGASNRTHASRHAGMVAPPGVEGSAEPIPQVPRTLFRISEEGRRTTPRVLRYRPHVNPATT